MTSENHPNPPAASTGPNLAHFSIGQTVHHRLFGYRGIVFDVDADFQLTDDWYEQVARSRPPKDRPWYKLLPDGASHTTYVAEQNLEDDDSRLPIHHPLIELLFERREDGYRLRESTH